ncbi:MAG: malto-oligosyltrehalose synthase [Acidimicrobiia bacterium]
MTRIGRSGRQLVGTYRLQLGATMDLYEAAGLVPMLHRLGVSHLYLSPVWQAAAGSAHGYDVVDPTRVSNALGGEAALRHLSEVAASVDMGLVLDIVPHHLSITDRANRWWWDVLRLGSDSRYASWFDVDWDAEGDGRIVLPVLGDHYGRALQRGDIRLTADDEDGAIVTTAGGLCLPLRPETFDALFGADADKTGTRSFDRERIAGVVDRVNDDVEALHEMLEAQHWRLARWTVSVSELGYRRFFDVNSLIAMRTERREVFDATHMAAASLVADGVADGLRVDHVDGLADPIGYGQRLRSVTAEAWHIAEKITSRDEWIPSEMLVHGTTGYDLATLATTFLVDPSGEDIITARYRSFTGDTLSWSEHSIAGKREALAGQLAPDLARLTGLFAQVCAHRRHVRDFTRSELSSALAAALVHTDRYRSYGWSDDDGRRVSDDDKRFVMRTLAGVRSSHPEIDAALIDLLEVVLVFGTVGGPESELATRFQQLSGPVFAKGVEDTALYRYTRLLALNDVGSDPDRWAIADSDLHAWGTESSIRTPMTMTTTSTHDSKRSADVRARLAVLSETGSAWCDSIDRWWDTRPAAAADVHPGDFWWLCQTIVGLWPIDPDRLSPIIIKTLREAKQRSSWLRPDEDYESAVTGLAAHMITVGWREIGSVVVDIAHAARANSLAQVTLRSTLGGVPDLYQGNESWTFAGVDPDNRRSPDFTALNRSLGTIASRTWSPSRWWSAGAQDDADLVKLAWTSELLGVLRRHGERMSGRYEPVSISGDASHCDADAVAYQRGPVVVIVPRWSRRDRRNTDETTIRLPPGRWRSVADGREIAGGTTLVSTLVAQFPVAVLEVSR